MNKRKLILALAALILCGQVRADDARQYHIPAQSLNNALLKFSADSGVEILFPVDKVRGLNGNTLEGSMTSAQALTRLLQGSGMTYRFVDAKTLTVEQPANVEEKPEPESSNGETTLPKVTVEAEYDPNDPYNTSDPYNKSYSVTNSSTATKTDTPIFDTPVSIQVVPNAILKDQQAYRIQDAVKNVSGVQQRFAGGGFDSFIIRGFESDQFQYRNGIRIPNLNFDFANVQQVEVLKGPASSLYGRSEPGGLINAVTKRASAAPYYSLEQRFSSYDLYRT